MTAQNTSPYKGAMSSPADAFQDVQAFYDAHPYPPPVKERNVYRALSIDLDRRRADHHVLWPATAIWEYQEVLIAG